MPSKKYPKYLKASFRKDGKKGSPRLLPGLKNIIIDIDGVVCENIPNEEPERMVKALEIPGARKQINEWYEEGHIITFFTSRPKELEKITKEWLKEHEFRYHKIIFDKPRGGNYHYIDNSDISAFKFEGKFKKI